VITSNESSKQRAPYEHESRDTLPSFDIHFDDVHYSNSNTIDHSVEHPHQSPTHDINLEFPNQDILTANGIRTSFNGNPSTFISDMALFSNNFDHSNLSTIDIPNPIDDALSVGSTTSLGELVRSQNNSTGRRSSSSSNNSDLTFTHALKINQNRRSDEGLGKSKTTYKISDIQMNKSGTLSENIVSPSGIAKSPTTVIKKEPSSKRELLIQEVSCLKCRVCSFLTQEKGDMHKHMKENHPQYLSDQDVVEDDVQPKKKLKVFIPRASGSPQNLLLTRKTPQRNMIKSSVMTVTEPPHGNSIAEQSHVTKLFISPTKPIQEEPLKIIAKYDPDIKDGIAQILPNEVLRKKIPTVEGDIKPVKETKTIFEAGISQPEVTDSWDKVVGKRKRTNVRIKKETPSNFVKKEK